MSTHARAPLEGARLAEVAMKRQRPRLAPRLGTVAEPKSLTPPMLDAEVLEALCRPRRICRSGEPQVIEYGRGTFVYLRMSRIDGSTEVFRFRTRAEASEAMRIAMEVDALAQSARAPD